MHVAGTLTLLCAQLAELRCGKRSGLRQPLLASISRNEGIGGELSASGATFDGLAAHDAHTSYLSDCLGVKLDKDFYLPPGRVVVTYDVWNATLAEPDDDADPVEVLCTAIQWAGLLSGRSGDTCTTHAGFRQQACPQVCPATTSGTGCE